PPRSTLFPYTTLFRSDKLTMSGSKFHSSEFVKDALGSISRVSSSRFCAVSNRAKAPMGGYSREYIDRPNALCRFHGPLHPAASRSEEHTSELQSPCNL